VTGGEHRNLVVLVHFTQHFLRVGPYVERSLEFAAGLKTDLQLDVWFLLRVLSSHAMGQSLVQIEKQELVDPQVPLLQLKYNLPAANLRIINRIHVLQKVN
jgi:hypothetical protein